MEIIERDGQEYIKVSQYELMNFYQYLGYGNDLDGLIDHLYMIQDIIELQDGYYLLTEL